MAAANPDKPLVADVVVAVNGKALPVAVAAHITSIMVDASLNLPSMFVLALAGSDDLTDDLRWIDDPNLFAVGQAFEVKMGYADNLATVISGEITGLEPEFSFNRPPLLTVRGYDRRHRLLQGRKTRTFVQLKDSEIAAKIASEAKLTADATDSQVTHDYVMQANQTDLEFLQERARRIHYEVLLRDKTLTFRPVANNAGEVATLTLERDLLEFHPALSSRGQVSEVAVRGWSLKEKAEIVGRAASGDEGGKMGGQANGAALLNRAFGAAAGLISDRPVMTQAEADQLAKAQLRQRSLTLIEGEGLCWGRTDLQPGVVIKLDGIGKRFGGQYYVTNAVHRYTPRRGYQTRFTRAEECNMNLYTVLNGAQEQAAQANRIFGVVVGVVTNNEDKEGLGRVKVKFPWLSAEDEGNWARIVTPMAGKGRGLYFLPEVEDEVLVVFEHGDIRFPYVLGALWNGKDAPPTTNSDGKNNLRLIQSRSGHLIRLNDEDGKETIEIVDKGQKNSIVFDSAKKTITVTADQDITLSAPQGTIKLDAKQIEIIGSGSAKVEASGGMDLKANGTLNVKGATVNIN